MSTPTVIRLVEDIAAQLRHQPVDEAASTVAHHLTMFWVPRMRAELIDLVRAGTACDAIVLEAVELLDHPIRVSGAST